MLSTHLIKVDGVTVAYGEKIAVNNLSLHCNDGELVGLLGPNGAGKTTLLEVIEGVKIADSGRVFICGSNPSQLALPQKRDVGFIFQRSALPPHVQVRQLVELIATAIPADASDGELLVELGLAELQHEVIGDLSVGQQQRLSAYVALHGRRRALVMDEPTAALDVRSKRAIWDCVLRKKRRQGTGGIIATHDMAEASALCDRVYFIEKGEIRGEASAAELSGGSSEQTFVTLTGPQDFFDNWPSISLLTALNADGAERREFRCLKSLVPTALEEIFQAEHRLGFNAGVVIGERSLEALYINRIETTS